LANSEENENNVNYKELLKQYTKDLEEIAVDLYNKQDFGSVERLCTTILHIYENLESENDISRMREILQKVALVDEYYDATFGLIKKQLEAKKEAPENKNSEK
jgi:hypothetical protein